MRLLGALAVRDELGKEDWALLVNLKRKFEQHYGEVRRPQLRSGAAAQSVRSVACEASPPFPRAVMNHWFKIVDRNDDNARATARRLTKHTLAV